MSQRKYISCEIIVSGVKLRENELLETTECSILFGDVSYTYKIRIVKVQFTFQIKIFNFQSTQFSERKHLNCV